VASPTHRLLAQRVKLLCRYGERCMVEYEDGSHGIVERSELVSVAAVRQDQQRVQAARIKGGEERGA
jgi:hypothetical protein